MMMSTISSQPIYICVIVIKTQPIQFLIQAQSNRPIANSTRKVYSNSHTLGLTYLRENQRFYILNFILIKIEKKYGKYRKNKTLFFISRRILWKQDLAKRAIFFISQIFIRQPRGYHVRFFLQLFLTKSTQTQARAYSLQFFYDQAQDIKNSQDAHARFAAYLFVNCNRPNKSILIYQLTTLIFLNLDLISLSFVREYIKINLLLQFKNKCAAFRVFPSQNNNSNQALSLVKN